MNHRNRILFEIGYLSLISLLSSCGPKHGDPVGPHPTVESLMAEGWKAYDSRDYGRADSLFLEVIDIKSDHVEAYIGLGWTHAQLGNFPETHSFFSLALSIPGARPTLQVFDENSLVDTINGLWTVIPNNLPLVGVEGVRNNSLDKEFSVLQITPTSILLETSASDIFDTSHVWDVDYFYYTSDLWTQEHGDAYSGEAGVFEAENEDMMAVVSANTVLQIADILGGYRFTHYPGTDTVDVHLILAQCYYNLRLFPNSCNEVELLDTTWTCDSTTTTSPTYLFDLMKKIENLRGG